MRELAYHKLKNGSTLVICEKGDKFEVACYAKNDIEEWSEEYSNADAAWRAYVQRKFTEKKPKKAIRATQASGGNLV